MLMLHSTGATAGRTTMRVTLSHQEMATQCEACREDGTQLTSHSTITTPAVVAA